MIFVPAERKQLLGILAVLACVIAMVVASGRGKFVTEYFDKATDDDRSFSKKTSGRSDQWEIVSKLLQDSPLWGFGVASGRKGALYYGGHDLVWHSLYLHLGAEGGWLFLSAALIFLSNLIKHGYRFLRRTGQILPLMATVCYMVIGVSVNTFDWMSGVYFGLAILGTGPWVSAQRTIQTPRRRQIQLSEPAT
jgi:O-antigen ligase